MVCFVDCFQNRYLAVGVKEFLYPTEICAQMRLKPIQIRSESLRITHLWVSLSWVSIHQISPFPALPGRLLREKNYSFRGIGMGLKLLLMVCI